MPSCDFIFYFYMTDFCLYVFGIPLFLVCEVLKGNLQGIGMGIIMEQIRITSLYGADKN